MTQHNKYPLNPLFHTSDPLSFLQKELKKKAHNFIQNNVISTTYPPLPTLSSVTLAQMIDHTLLSPTSNQKDFEKLCQDASLFPFQTLCVPLDWVLKVKRTLKKKLSTKSSTPKVITVIGFPLGAEPTTVKAFQVQKALTDGAEEIDTVLPLSRFFSEAYLSVWKEIHLLAQLAHPIPLKVILETGYLTPEQIVLASWICEHAGACWIKTSTGFGPRGASFEDVVLLKKALSDSTQIKASGGIRTLSQALTFIALGAKRLGTSKSVSILKQIQPTPTFPKQPTSSSHT